MVYLGVTRQWMGTPARNGKIDIIEEDDLSGHALHTRADTRVRSMGGTSETDMALAVWC